MLFRSNSAARGGCGQRRVSRLPGRPPRPSLVSHRNSQGRPLPQQSRADHRSESGRGLRSIEGSSKNPRRGCPLLLRCNGPWERERVRGLSLRAERSNLAGSIMGRVLSLHHPDVLALREAKQVALRSARVPCGATRTYCLLSEAKALPTFR